MTFPLYHQYMTPRVQSTRGVINPSLGPGPWALGPKPYALNYDLESTGKTVRGLTSTFT